MSVIVQALNLFLGGTLAGAEVVVRLAVHGAISSLDDAAHIRVRQALIRRLRILVPMILFPSFITAVLLVTLFGAPSSSAPPVSALRLTGLCSLSVMLLIAVAGTVPINKRLLAWTSDAPPPNWKDIISRWQNLDTVRCTAAVVAFAAFVCSFAVELSQ